uniref:Amino acid permease n=1 Tax=Panagrellus redivivus TaxID=6233 RepID=A0A7E4UV29_PANRE
MIRKNVSAGAHGIRDAIHEMVGFKVSTVWPLIWKYVSPLVTAILFIFCIVMYAPLKYPDGRDFPMWAEIVGFGLSLCSILSIPGYALYYLLCKRNALSFNQRLHKGLHPPKNLRPSTQPYTVEEELEFIDKGSKEVINNNDK